MTTSLILFPKNDLTDPFRQLKYLFDSYTSLFHESKRQKYLIAKSKFIKFITSDTNSIGYVFPEPFDVERYFDARVAISFKRFLQDEVLAKKLIAETASQMLSRFNKVAKYAYHNRWTKHLILEATIDYTVEGRLGAHDSFSDSEMNRIREALKDDLRFVSRLVNFPLYKKSNVGKNPLIKGKRNGGSGFSNLNNCIWYFENTMACIPRSATNANQRIFPNFFTALGEFHGGAYKFYRDLGVIDIIDNTVIGCLFVSLAMETGLNPSSLTSLKKDCLAVNELTGIYFIQFDKNRSGGSNQLMLNTHDNNIEISDIKKRQLNSIKRIIEQTLSLTERIRHAAPDAMKDYLFLVQSRSPRNFGKVMVFDVKVYHGYCRSLVKRFNILDDNGSLLKLTIVRFRPTMLSKMAREGWNEFEIQDRASHKSIVTTAKYMRLKNLEFKLQADAIHGLESVYSLAKNFDEFKNEQSPGKITKIFKGLFCDCKNVFDPPVAVKKLKNYREGQACTWYNMCLTCHNVIITKFHLPLLFVYRDQIKFSDEFQNKEVPYYHLYSQMLSVMNSILDAKTSEFSEAELEEAKIKSEQVRHLYIDSVYHLPAGQ